MQGEKNTQPLVFVDIETTGGSPQTSRVLELAALRMEGGQVVDTINMLFDPGVEIPWFITQLTGIKAEDTWGAPSFSAVAPRFRGMLQDAIFVAHNVEFDYQFLRAEYELLDQVLDVPRACTVRLSRHFYPEERHHRLDAVIDRHTITVEDRHRALGDAQALVDFYRILCGEFGSAGVDEVLLGQAARSA